MCARACKFQQVEQWCIVTKHAFSKKKSSFLVPVDVPLIDSGLFKAPLFVGSTFHAITAVDDILVDPVVL